MKVFFQWIAYGTIIAWAGLIIQLAIWYYMPVNIIDYYDLPAKVLNPGKEVKRGEYLEFELHYEKFHQYPAKLSRCLVNDRLVALTCETSAAMPEGRKKTVVRVFIPLNVWPADYKLVTDVEYSVNPLKQVHERYETEWFRVTE